MKKYRQNMSEMHGRRTLIKQGILPSPFETFSKLLKENERRRKELVLILAKEIKNALEAQKKGKTLREILDEVTSKYAPEEKSEVWKSVEEIIKERNKGRKNV